MKTTPEQHAKRLLTLLLFTSTFTSVLIFSLVHTNRSLIRTNQSLIATNQAMVAEQDRLSSQLQDSMMQTMNAMSAGSESYNHALRDLAYERTLNGYTTAVDRVELPDER